MSLADDAKLLLIPTGYKASKVYSVFPTDGDGDFTYTRSGDASRVNPGGLIETVGTNIPRIDHTGGGCPTLLLEPQRTNYCLNNTQLHLNSTLSSGATITLTGNYAIAPDGTLTATRIQASGTGSNYAYLSMNGTNPTTDGSGSGYYRSSVYVKSNTGSNQTIILFAAGASAPFTREVTTEWSRIEILGYRPANAKYTYIGYSSGADEELDFLVWGGQTELVNSYASSLIYTGATIITRQKDQCYNGGDADLFDISKGTFFIDANNFGTPLNAYSMITLSDGTLTNYIRFLYESSRIRVTLVSNNSTSIDYFITGVNDNERNKTLITFKENEFKIYHNGILKTTDTSGNVPINLDRFNFSMTNNFSRWFEGEIHDARVYDRVLTQTEAETLTTL